MNIQQNLHDELQQVRIHLLESSPKGPQLDKGPESELLSEISPSH
jgi:hypothetical protein